MLKIIIPTIMIIPAIWLAPQKMLWRTALVQSFLVSNLSFMWLYPSISVSATCLGSHTGLDRLSTPLIMLTCWLLPLMILASQNHTSHEPLNHQRTYITLLTSLQVFLLTSFSASELILFYVMFEATLIPTLIIITRWGSQAQRLEAGIYFLFYTMTSSLPLLIALVTLHNTVGSLCFFTMPYTLPFPMTSVTAKLWWLGCLLAFLVKLPLYGVHLWLPKAHVEAPIAGSMVLAAILLKLGGYGMMRMMIMLEPLTKSLCYPLIILALWGLLMTASICMRQTDLKSLIAYSSVAHMGLVAAAILIQTPLGYSGAIMLMIAHGLTSSALFCLANTNYERMHTRTMLLARGLHIALPVMAVWWFLFTLANLALPPLPNLMGELLILISLINWSSFTITLTGSAVLITAAYSLYMYSTTQRGPLPKHIKTLPPNYTREHLLITLHMTPLLYLIAFPDLIWG
uniref:NADH-ubiquinone oxidoreductase chain 4 n=1 Tax=Trimma grammistes TaxID=1231923 RepID=A0A455TQZ2_9GOBI|nr:NADH dehydrogenase subunit 4 [Trimma grammistes]